MFAAICLLIGWRNGELNIQALRVLDGAMKGTLSVPSARKRPYLSPIVKKQVAAAQKWRCASCGKLLDGAYEIDHILPIYKGGQTIDVTCKRCTEPVTLQNLQWMQRHLHRSTMRACLLRLLPGAFICCRLGVAPLRNCTSSSTLPGDKPAPSRRT